MPSIQFPRPTALVERRLNSLRHDSSAKPVHIHRERDFGVGYGNSSGYASDRATYIAPGPAYFRCR